MIRIHIKRRSDRTITGFTMDGHADYDEHGKDIVCAGVTAVAFGTVNSIEALLGVDMQPQATNRGHLTAKVPLPGNPQQAHDLQLLLESMVNMLRGIEASYGQHIQIEEKII